MESSTYKKLHSQETLVLVLSQGAGTDAIFGRLITRNLKHYIQALENRTTDEDVESFEALSYTWDPSLRGYPFPTEDGIVQITLSLKIALQRLRLANKHRILWADGICINQDDLSEREEQVRLMGDIYRTARRTVVFLGEETRAPQGSIC